MPNRNASGADAVVRQWFERVWNNGEENAIDDLVATDAVARGLSSGDLKGPDQFKPFFQSMRASFPDIGITLLRCVTEGDLCAAHYKVTGTHKGDGLGFPATGRKVVYEGMTMFRVADGKLQEGWNCLDSMSLFQQLGLIPVPPGQPVTTPAKVPATT
ncbi:MAG: ester cyclase [Acidobacteria bacterium]|nr:ester cyclase [Acidobacteriota bacterium]